ncbi:hypothetical protein JZ751_018480 [Albula glossodonta]|uniref:Uncharacterized protein n=1 Tax=Albula glossodonta TaxID=121402 RepID=A0A8T2NW96_9TELE|nr:hypothetical protein JZ751_018480 [Albula glossodonta]
MQLDWKANGSEWIWSTEGSVSVPNANTGEGVCYQNWGPNQEGKHGHTGAVESHENHSWVSLPETEKLNFICFT